jgi:ATP-dependent Clp protease protease subunit
MSAATVLLAAGTRGMRRSLPNATLMVHQPSGGAQGQASDILIHAEHTRRLRERLNGLYVRHCGQPLEAIEAALDRDHFMSSEEARDWGLIDEIVAGRDGAKVAGTGLEGTSEA